MAANTKFEHLKKVVGGLRSDAAPTTADQDFVALRLNANSELIVSIGGGTGAVSIQGPDADGAASTSDPVQVAGVDGSGNVQTLLVDTSGRPEVVGTQAAETAVDDGSFPVKIGNLVRAILTTITDDEIVNALADTYGRAYVREAAFDSLLNADAVALINEERNAVDNFALNIDTTNVAISTVNYPSDSGIEMDGYRLLSTTGKFIIAAGGTITLTVQVANDEDATPANRDWITINWWEPALGTYTNSVVCTATTTTFAISLEELEANFRYIRFNVVVAGSAVNTVILKSRRIP